MPRRGLVITSAPGAGLTVVRVDAESVTLSTGEVLIARYEKLRNLAEQLCQEGTPVVVRTWTCRDGVELVELYRASSSITPRPGVTKTSGSETDHESF